MPGLITALTRSAIKRLREKKTNNKLGKNKKFRTVKIRNLILKAFSNNVKIQSDKTLKLQKFTFSLIKSRWDFILATSRQKQIMRGNSKNDKKFFNQNIFKRQKNIRF